MPTRLGLLAGSGALPARLIERCRATGRELFLLCFEGQTDPALADGVPHAWTRLGAADEAIGLLRAAGITEIVMAGAIRRPSAQELRPDWRAAKLLARIGMGALGDDGLLRAVKAELEREGFRLVGVDELMTELVAPAGCYTKTLPDAQAEADIAYGFEVVAALGRVDVGQAAVVQQGVTLGVEGVEGTDALLARAGTLARPGAGGVLVKAAKPGQSRQMDLPTIGPDTVEHAAASGLRGIAVEAGSTLVVDRERVVERADALGLFVLGRKAETPPLFYLIAGEPSGDALGAGLMRALRTRTGGAARFAGIGGEQMAAEGLESLLPIRGLAIMGVIEVLPAARRIFRWVRETVDDIERLKPAAVVTIDSSGFCFRVGEKLKRQSGPNGRRPLIVHYVAPMVWAWRPYRARHAARAADHLLTLFPFEPPYFEAVGLKSSFVGHPVIEDGTAADPAGFRARHGIGPGVPIVTVLPGSRRSEVRALLPIFRAAIEHLGRRVPGLVAVLPTVGTVAEEVTRGAAGWSVPAIMLRGAAEKRDAFAASTAALAASGTVALELAAADLPMVVAYRIWAVTAWTLRRSLKIRFVSLVNILLDRPVVPELLQQDCTPGKLAAALGTLFADAAARDEQRHGFAELRRRLSAEGRAPSDRAAETILQVASERAQLRSSVGT